LTQAESAEQRAQIVANVLAQQPDLGDVVVERMNEVLEGENLRLARTRMHGGRVGAEIVRNGRSVNLVNEAFGVNQLLPLFLTLLKAEPGSTIGIEEPEIHLHPRAQAALARSLAGIARSDNKQLILTTHSEHVLMALLTEVAQSRLAVDDF